MKNIGFCKVGKTIKFITPYSPIGGDNEAPQLLRALANNNPNINFYITGRSDFSRMSETEKCKQFKFGNVIDVFENQPGAAHEDAIINYFKDAGIILDGTIMMVGQIGSVTIPNKTYRIREHRPPYAAVIDMTRNYTTPITKWWNENPDMKVIEIINDPRYTFKQPRDVLCDPFVSLSQYTYEYEKTPIRSFEDQERVSKYVPVKYAEMEKIFLCGRPLKPINIKDRTIPFMIVLNEGKPSRYDMLNEWVLSGVEDVEIYGKWDHPKTLSDERFKGSIQLDEVHEKLSHVRSAFIIPIADGWATSKYVELIHAGVVPILHPSYDSQKNTGIYNQLRPKTVNELNELIINLQNDDFYLELITRLQKDICSDEYLDGSKLSKVILSEFDSNYELPDKTQYEVKSTNTLQNFFK